VIARWDERAYGPQTVVPLSPLKVTFDRVWPMLKRAVDRWGPTHRKWHVWSLVESGNAQLWASEKAAIVTSINITPTGFKEVGLWLAGGDMRDGLPMVPAIEQWAKTMGCARTVIRGGRTGWAAILTDYRRAAITLVKEL
jgi:hypothetical protein